MSTQDTLPRRILRGTLWTIRKALALAVMLGAVASQGLVIFVIYIAIREEISQLGAGGFFTTLAMIVGGLAIVVIVISWATYELSKGRK